MDVRLGPEALRWRAFTVGDLSGPTTFPLGKKETDHAETELAIPESGTRSNGSGSIGNELFNRGDGAARKHGGEKRNFRSGTTSENEC